MAETLSPMMQQYQGIRRTLPPDTLLLFRLGDFYEMFFEDAKEAAGILDVALTKRNGVPMCGVPFHAAEGYLAKLIKAGRRAAICDQVGEVVPGRIVQREVTQIITPGTISDVNLLEARRNNYLAAIFEREERYGFAYVDLSTGEFRLTEVESMAQLEDELARVCPSEVLVSEEQAEQLCALAAALSTRCDGYAFLADQAGFALRSHFQVQSLDGFGCTDMPAAVGAAGAILHYLKTGLRRQISHITRLTCYRNSQFMIVDAATQANLELVASRGGARDTSLLAALDRTVTPMGARRLRDWILHPLCKLEPLRERQDFIAELLAESFLLSQARDSLKGVRDIERTVARLNQAGGNARDLLVLQNSLKRLPDLKTHLRSLAERVSFGANGCGTGLRARTEQDLHEFPDLVSLLETALVDDPPIAVKEGGMFRDGYSEPLDELRAAGTEGKKWIAELQQREIERTGIKSLKVRYTSVFGYFIEITKANLGSVPADYHRKQTTVNGERFITPELKEMENKILGADERAQALEYDLFHQVRQQALRWLAELQATASAIATLDVIAAFAETARLFGYCRPELTEAGRLEIRDGRHPVLDQSLVEEKFVPNDVELDGGPNRLLIITGPNMAGKSTFIRQVALLTLMAQIGSYLPASRAEVGLADRIFTRVGASDDLSRGQSTFMVEMNETANILNNATERSLIILDEIGRGTSTFDGLSIAWSIAEFLHDRTKARTLFATHYHELTELEMTRSGVKNYNVAVREWNEQIIFLRKIIRGGADKSYGIQVARLAGLPPEVIGRAKEVLSNLELAELNADGKPKIAEKPPLYPARKRKKTPGLPITDERPQMSLF
ncbi:MAG TPA: DNA mismatch repair protein MutS [Chthoniobacteraceae bacterium]|jgi:DNA mismatch repair protein MutS|nr:DNA mismatch repair protein MutS [Chthoniobacteraceae bacterium]